MPTKTYGSESFTLLNVGLGCIGLDLSSGENRFDVHRLNHPNEPSEGWCGQPANSNTTDICLTSVTAEVRSRIKQVLCDIHIPVPEIVVKIGGGWSEVRFGKCRLNHLEKQFAAFAWSAERGGALLLEIEFSGSGTEILGAFHGDINNARARIYLPLLVDDDGALGSGTPQVEFTANVNFHGVAYELEKGARKRIRSRIKEAIEDVFSGDLGDDLVQFVVESLPDPPPPNSFFTDVTIGANSATLAWTTDVQRTQLIVDDIVPSSAQGGTQLTLRIRFHRSGVVGEYVTFTVMSGQFALPITTPSLREVVPNTETLRLDAELSSVSILFDPPQPTKLLGTIHTSFGQPQLGHGPHQHSQGTFSLSYRIKVL